MRLYRIECDGGYHYARTKGALKRALVELEAQKEDVSLIELSVNAHGIFDALREGANAAGGHIDVYPRIFGDPDYE